MILTKAENRGCIPKLKYLGNVKLQSAASKRFKQPLFIERQNRQIDVGFPKYGAKKILYEFIVLVLTKR